MRWTIDQAEAIVKATPEIPPGFQNRRRANWKPLLAIAEACGPEWKTAAWKAALAIEKIADTFETSIGVQLLHAIKAAFEARGMDQITAAGLGEDLIADATAPWATYNKGKPISQRQVGRLLAPYGIGPKTMRMADGSFPKGYLLEWFTDAFERFCGALERGNSKISAHTSTDLFSKDFPPPTPAPADPSVGTRKSNENNDVETWAPNSAFRRSNGSPSAAKSKSDDLPYRGPVVEVREPDEPDELDQHGAPTTIGLSESRRRELAAWCDNWKAEGEADEDLDDALRNTIREELDDMRQVEAELERIKALVKKDDD
jgi:hypothetical protein